MEEQEKKITVDQAIKISNIILKANKNNFSMIEYVFSKSEFTFDEFKEYDFTALQDTLGEYINECYDTSKDARVRKSEFENGYFKYCNDHNKKALKKGEIKILMDELGYPVKKYQGFITYKGLTMK